VILRRFTAADADGLAALHGSAAVMRYIAPPGPGPSVESILREYDSLPAGMGRFAAAAPDFVGWFSLRPAMSAGLAPGDVELGYRLLPSHWGRGLATEGALLLVERAFTELGLPRVAATTMAVNTASRRVLEKAGLRHTRTFHADWPDPLPGAEEGDVVYEVTAADWRGAVRCSP
jgi:RimJ/RimL family protein N-acetyltransferase